MTSTVRTLPTPDAPDGYDYLPAPEDVQRIMRKRFEDHGITAIDPDRPGVYRHDVGNWWDGWSEVLDNGDGSFTYENPYTGERDRFDADGSWWSDGQHHPWEASAPAVCGCEHTDHFSDERGPQTAHDYVSVSAGRTWSAFVGYVCDECASTHSGITH